MLFDIISPIYALFFNYQVKHYRKILNRIRDDIDITQYKRVLDLVISSYVLHGLKPKEREELYKELCRVSKGKIIFHDYNETRSLVTDIAEFLENGDYFNFIKIAKSEMEKYFKDVRVVDVDKKAAWYILKHCNI